jgi:hypothetical protein
MNHEMSDWIRNARPPGNLYELLGRPRFDPDSDGLKESIAAAYRLWRPYLKHPKPEVAGRARDLLEQLGRAQDVFGDPAKHAAYDQNLVRTLTEDYARQRGSMKRAWSVELLRRWLVEEQGVHPVRLEAILATLLSEAGRDASPSQTEPAGRRDDSERPTTSPSASLPSVYTTDYLPDPSIPSERSLGSPSWQRKAQTKGLRIIFKLSLLTISLLIILTKDEMHSKITVRRFTIVMIFFAFLILLLVLTITAASSFLVSRRVDEALFKVPDRPGQVAALERIGPRAVKTLMEHLSDENANVRLVVVAALGRFGPAAAPAVPRLVEILADDELIVRKTTARALRRIGPDAAPAAPYLINCITTTDPDLCMEAVNALNEIDPNWPRSERAKQAVPRLIELLNDDEQQVRTNADMLLKLIDPDGRWKRNR